MEETDSKVITSSLDFLCKNTTSVEQLTVLAITASLMTKSEREKIIGLPNNYLQNYEFYAHMMKKPGGMDHLLRFLRDVLNDGVAQHLEEQLKIATKAAAKAPRPAPGDRNSAAGSESVRRLTVAGENQRVAGNDLVGVGGESPTDGSTFTPFNDMNVQGSGNWVAGRNYYQGSGQN